MKSIGTIFVILGGALVLVYLLLKKKSTNSTSNASQKPAQTTTGTSTGGQATNWFSGWLGYTNTSLQNAQASATGINSLLTQVSNLFGSNPNTANPGVNIAGNNFGGSSSAGSGAGVATPLSNTISDIWSRAFTQNDYETAPLNNYDVLNTPNLNSSTNAVDTGVYGGNDFGLYGF